MFCLVIDKDNISQFQNVDDIRRALNDQIRKQEKEIKEMKAKNK